MASSQLDEKSKTDTSVVKSQGTKTKAKQSRKVEKPSQVKQDFMGEKWLNFKKKELKLYLNQPPKKSETKAF